MSELKPCPCCMDAEEQDLSMPTSCDDIEYVVCQLCGLRVDAESWDCLPRIPEGYKLVPVNPTEAMIDEGFMALGWRDRVTKVYKAMIEAAEE